MDKKELAYKLADYLNKKYEVYLKKEKEVLQSFWFCAW